MSLDIAIMDQSGKPTASVPISTDEHWSIIQQAQQMALPLWSRLSDYYEDADFEVEEVSVLLNETTRLRHGCQNAGFLGKLEEIEKLLRMAIDGHNSVSAIAD